MKKIIPGSLLIILSGIILLLFSCTPGSCLEETESYLKASFYNNETDKPLAPDTLTIYGFGTDSIIYNKQTGVKVALFPLNASSENSKFVIIINGLTDTIEFQYSSYPHLISKECGYTFYHHLDSATYQTNTIKGIYISNAKITNLNVENIRIRF